MAQGDQPPVGQQPLGVAVQVDVGPVGDVQAQPLDQPDQGVLVAKELPAPLCW